MSPATLRPPREHLGIRIEPGELWSGGLPSHGNRADASFGDLSLGELKARLRAELGLGPRVVASGHQAEFFHAGVLAKLLAADALRARTQADLAWFVVDSDILKQTALRVPIRKGESLGVREIRFPATVARIPAEAQPAGSAADWRGFFAMAASACAAGPGVMPEMEAAWLRAAGPDGMVGAVAGHTELVATGFAAAGGQPDQLKMILVSQVAATAAFFEIVAAMLREPSKVHESYNAALVFAAGHAAGQRPPSAVLRRGNGRTELPLWWLTDGRRRGRLAVGEEAGRVVIFSDDEPVADLSLDDVRTGTRLKARLSERELAPRPRALLLSLLLRWLAADLFIHGAGGVEYDVATDEWSRLWLGAAPPAALGVTATCLLPLGVQEGADEQRPSVSDVARDVFYNPQRWLRDINPGLLAERDRLVNQSGTLRRSDRENTVARREVFQAIRAITGAIREEHAEQVATLQAQAVQARERLAAQALARDRTWFFGMLSAKTLNDLAEAVRRYRPVT